MVEIVEQIPDGASLFDVGCGSGTLLHLGKQFRHVKKASGYDISPSAVEASTVFENINVQLLSVGDPLPSLSGYDVISVVDVLHHIPVDQQDEFISEIIKLMDVGSELLIADINAEKKVGAFLNWIHDLLLAREWVHPSTPAKVESLISKLGCEVLHCSLHRTLWYPHFIMKVKKVTESQ
ncbi:MAG: methyltransferase domain-containing protein [Mariprofundaceae bacterium]